MARYTKRSNAPKADTEKKDMFQEITDRIISLIETNGHLPWSRPWDLMGEMPRNLKSKKAYRGYNTWMLLFEQQKKAYKTGWWVTYNQAQEMGGNVRKGEKSTMISFYQWVPKKDATGQETKDKRPFMKCFWVFNVDQCENLEDRVPVPTTRENGTIDHCEKIGAAMQRPIEIKHGGDKAYYRPSEDYIQLPERNQFHDVTDYYLTRFHEMVHSTGHKERLDRATLVDMVAFGDQNYSKEELVAELGASFLCAFTGITSAENEKNSAGYLKGWASKLKEDKKLFTSAASAAQKALDYILGKDAEGLDGEVEETETDTAE
jgi:antirestriction protein ArdC